MNKVIFAVVAIVLAGGVLFGLLGSSSSDEATKQSNTVQKEEAVTAGENEVFIKDFEFGPETLTIKKGTTITWTNMDDAGHDITPTSGADDFLRSDLLQNGETYSFTFNEVGSYEYKCSPHPYMKGMIEVTE